MNKKGVFLKEKNENLLFTAENIKTINAANIQLFKLTN
jgi:hypothetical protein